MFLISPQQPSIVYLNTATETVIKINKWTLSEAKQIEKTVKEALYSARIPLSNLNIKEKLITSLSKGQNIDVLPADWKGA